jgi:phosphate transport system permease protein
MAQTAIVFPPAPSLARKFIERLRNGDEVAHLITFIFATSVFLLTVLLVYELWIHSSAARDKFGLAFLFSRIWDPVAEKFGALPFIYGTLLTSFVALPISVPLGVGAAIFLSEWLRRESPAFAHFW